MRSFNINRRLLDREVLSARGKSAPYIVVLICCNSFLNLVMDFVILMTTTLKSNSLDDITI